MGPNKTNQPELHIKFIKYSKVIYAIIKEDEYLEKNNLCLVLITKSEDNPIYSQRIKQEDIIPILQGMGVTEINTGPFDSLTKLISRSSIRTVTQRDPERKFCYIAQLEGRLLPIIYGHNPENGRLEDIMILKYKRKTGTQTYFTNKNNYK